jgi:TRAP-type C4-dicarboxylate transport system permease small subunit
MPWSRRLLSAMFAVEVTVAIAAYVIIAGLLLTDIVMRETGSGSLWGAQRISVYLMIVIGFLGLGLAAARGRHLRPRFLDGVLPEKFNLAADRIGSVLMALIFGGFGIVAIQFVAEAIEYNEIARIIRIPMWYIQMVVPYAFFSTALRYVIFAVDPGSRPEEALE